MGAGVEADADTGAAAASVGGDIAFTAGRTGTGNPAARRVGADIIAGAASLARALKVTATPFGAAALTESITNFAGRAGAAG